MKSSNYTIPTELHDSLKQFILNAIRISNVYMVFYIPVVNSSLKLITLVVAKDTDGDTLAGLHSQIKVLDALTQHDTLISVNYHTVAPHHSQFHFSFLQLHLQPCFIVYADQPKRWNSLFQNFYSEDKQKALVLFANHIKTVENRIKEAVTMLVEPLVENSYIRQLIQRYWKPFLIIQMYLKTHCFPSRYIKILMNRNSISFWSCIIRSFLKP